MRRSKGTRTILCHSCPIWSAQPRLKISGTSKALETLGAFHYINPESHVFAICKWYRMMADFSIFTSKFRAHKNDSHESPAARVMKRPRLMCNQCQKSKLRCDRGHPCSSCVKKDEASACSYQRPTGVENRRQSQRRGRGQAVTSGVHSQTN